MLTKKNTRQEKKVSPKGIVFEYEINSNNIGIAKSEIDGRMPEEGFAVNKKCEEIFYVIKGFAKFNLDGKEFDISEGDVVVIKPNQKFYYLADNLEIAISTSPPWFPEQWENIK